MHKRKSARQRKLIHLNLAVTTEDLLGILLNFFVTGLRNNISIDIFVYDCTIYFKPYYHSNQFKNTILIFYGAV
jgi:hypothetical protein